MKHTVACYNSPSRDNKQACQPIHQTPACACPCQRMRTQNRGGHELIPTTSTLSKRKRAAWAYTHTMNHAAKDACATPGLDPRQGRKHDMHAATTGHQRARRSPGPQSRTKAEAVDTLMEHNSEPPILGMLLQLLVKEGSQQYWSNKPRPSATLHHIPIHLKLV
jgi:hypothetical protein